MIYLKTKITFWTAITIKVVCVQGFAHKVMKCFKFVDVPVWWFTAIFGCRKLKVDAAWPVTGLYHLWWPSYAWYDNDSSELMIFYASLLYMTWNHNDAIRCLALEPSPWHTVIIIYLVFVNDGCLGSKSLISGWQCSICGTNCSEACWCQLLALFFCS